MPDVIVPDDDGSNSPFPQDLGAAVVRTSVPYVSAWLVAYLAKNGMTLDANQVNAAAVTIGGSLWYVVIRSLEQKWPKAGWLLGSPKQPTYKKGD